ncbi:MAG: hypothetical protein EBS90_13075 [Betaproteobacteria bacterium]|nr:hypothetical protein [Betaproteobacteria bacterium]
MQKMHEIVRQAYNVCKVAAPVREPDQAHLTRALSEWAAVDSFGAAMLAAEYAAGKRTARSIVSAWLDFKQDGWL